MLHGTGRRPGQGVRLAPGEDHGHGDDHGGRAINAEEGRAPSHPEGDRRARQACVRYARQVRQRPGRGAVCGQGPDLWHSGRSVDATRVRGWVRR